MSLFYNNSSAVTKKKLEVPHAAVYGVMAATVETAQQTDMLNI